MQDDFSFNLSRAAAEFLHLQVKDLQTTLPPVLARAWHKYIAGFTEYLSQMQDRAGLVKTLLYRSTAVPLADLYVGTLLQGPRLSQVDERDVVAAIGDRRHLFISATAGSGKSFFARFLFMNLLNSTICVPILIELRNLNRETCTLVEHICSLLGSKGYAQLDPPHFLQLATSGKVCLILDGVDELASTRSNDICNEILSLVRTLAGRCPIVVLSRPDEQLPFAVEFDCYEILPLTESQAISLITKLDYDAEVKEAFLSKLRSDLFENHRDFLSNPLLLTLMLMTYGDTAEIPAKLHIFYQHAFDVLFHRHDASKTYRREMKSGLAIDDFKKLLSSVAASGYIRDQVQFTRDELAVFVERGMKVWSLIDVDPQSFIDDLLVGVCILIQDGSRLSYTHRSFQEYFAALFLVTVPSGNKDSLYDNFLPRQGTGNALKIACGINRDLIEAEFILPRLSRFLDRCGGDGTILCTLWGKSLRIDYSKSGPPEYRNLQLLICVPSEDFYLCKFLYSVYSGRPVPEYTDAEKIEREELMRELDASVDEYSYASRDIHLSSEADRDLMRRIGLFRGADNDLAFLHKMHSAIEKRVSARSGNIVTEWL